MDAAVEHVDVVRRPVRRVLLGSVRELALVPAIVVLVIVGVFTSPAFFTTANFSNTAQFSAALGLVVVGGLLFSQLVTLYLTPVVYTYMAQLQTWMKARQGTADLRPATAK